VAILRDVSGAASSCTKLVMTVLPVVVPVVIVAGFSCVRDRETDDGGELAVVAADAATIAADMDAGAGGAACKYRFIRSRKEVFIFEACTTFAATLGLAADADIVAAAVVLLEVAADAADAAEHVEALEPALSLAGVYSGFWFLLAVEVVVRL
jgi:hypothetical protein